MRNFKIFVAIAISGITSLFIYSCTKDLKENQNINLTKTQLTETRSGDDVLDLIGVDCFNFAGTAPGCNNVAYTDTLILTNVTDYPGCSFTVVYRYFTCISGGFTDVSISDFQMLSHNCQKFSDEILNKRNTSIWSDFIHEFDAKIHAEIQKHLVSVFVTPNKFKCGSGSFFNIKFFSSSCYKYCTAQSNFGKEGPKYYFSTKVACGLQCCETHTKICRKPDGTLQTQVLIAPIYPPFCQDESLLTNSYECLKKGDAVWMSSCTFDRDKCIP